VLQIAFSTIPAAGFKQDQPIRIVMTISIDAVRGVFAPVDPDHIQLYLVRADGTQQTAVRYPGGGIERDDLGIFSADFTPDSQGTYRATARVVEALQTLTQELSIVVDAPNAFVT
jgi:hypothetical protein